MNYVVLKFGGTSVKDSVAMRNVSKILIGKIKKNNRQKLVIFLSATAKTTDTLINIIDLTLDNKLEKSLALKNELFDKHNKIIKELKLDKFNNVNNFINTIFNKLEILIKGIFYLGEITPKAKDSILSTGELLSSYILSTYLKKIFNKNFIHFEKIDQKPNLSVEWFDIRKVMLTDNNFTSAQPEFETINVLCQKFLLPVIEKNTFVITQGFIGATKNGETTTLGRGGSDYSASIIGAAINAKKIEIWTDVSGIYTTDPKIAKNAYPLSEISFKEAAELSYFGAKVLHPSTIIPAMKKNIPVFVKNTNRPDDYGTKITNSSYTLDKLIKLKAIAFRKNITLINIESTRMLNAYGFLSKIFAILSKYKISVDLISTSEISVSLTLDSNTFNHNAINELKQYANIAIKDNLAIIALVSENIKKIDKFLETVFNTLNTIPVEMITFGSSNINLSIVVENKFVEDSIKNLHKKFFE